jgi:hypothetical protein
MLYIDEKYIKLISYKFRNFKKLRTSVYNLSCPICGDSQKKKSKARGYFYPSEDHTGMIYKCHNCGVSIGLSSFLKDVCNEYYQDYLLEKFDKPKRPEKKEIEVVYKPVQFKQKLEGAICITQLDDDHFAKKYIIDRMIPESAHKRIYFTEDFAACVNACFPDRYNLAENEARIVLPFWDEADRIIGLQGRALLQSDMRYITCRASDDLTLVYGLDTYDSSKLVYVVEGPFDSLFLDNCLAVAGSGLNFIEKRLSEESDFVLVFDNEPRNKEIVRIMNDSINKGYKVCIPPENWKEKDINDMILASQTAEKIKKMIEENTYSGLEAELNFSKWRKV